MIKEFVLAWEKNKGSLENYLRTHKQEDYDTYKALVKLIFDHVINPEMDKDWRRDEYDTDNILCIDDGNYQGTLLFILHENTYQPDANDYVCTHVYYGSCSGCDTLQGIHHYSDELPTEEQIKDYMQLCLHLLQHCTYMAEEESDETNKDLEIEALKQKCDRLEKTVSHMSELLEKYT